MSVPADPSVTDAPPPSATDTRRLVRIIRWRRAQAFAAFVLASTFFMPIVEGCRSPVYPYAFATELCEDILFGNTSMGYDEFLLFLAATTAAYAFGLIVTVTLLRRRRPDTVLISEGRTALVTLTLVTGFMLLAAAYIQYQATAPAIGLEIGDPILLAIIAVSFLYCLGALRNRTGGALCLRWYLAICAIVWFCWLRSDGTACWGLYLSLGASGVLLICASAEARLASLQRWPGVIGNLLLARLELLPPDQHVCRKCGYNLFGLTTPRCPECGTAFEHAFSLPLQAENAVGRNTAANVDTSSTTTEPNATIE